MMTVTERFREGGVLFDGGLGTMLIAKGLPLGRPPEEWNLTHPGIVRDVHLSYLRAGAEVVTANTFGATASRMAGYGLGERLGEINRAGVALVGEAVTRFCDEAPVSERSRGLGSRETARPLPRQTGGGARRPEARFVAVSLGPTGKMFPPVGKADEGELREEFAGQLSGIDSGYELIAIETMYDLREALVALKAARVSTAAPVAVTLTYNKNPRGFFTIMGDEAARATRTLVDAGADVVGANCTLASKEMIALGRVLRESSDGPILCQPNAGQPRVEKGVPVYDQTPEDFARDALELFSLGINAVGGCCGTTPAFIQQVSARLHEQ